MTEEEETQETTPPPPRRRRRLRRALLVTAIVVLVLALAGAGFVVWTVRQSFPQLDGEAAVPGLNGEVEVVRDSLGVPRIYGDEAEDLFQAQGYVHAQDRFWEMDVRRHLSAGRLAEMFGEGQVSVDKVVRTIGWYRVAEQEVELLSARTRGYLQAYADGVNAYLAEHDGASLSVEYAILGVTGGDYQPPPWRPADSIAWLKTMAWELNGGMDVEVQRSLLASAMPQEVVDQLYPEYDFDARPPIVGPGESNGAAVRPVASVRADQRVESVLREIDTVSGVLDGLLGPRGIGVGSNSWVIGGSRTASGQPILANDPHLAPQLPSTWYQAGLHCRAVTEDCPFDVSGFGFAGMPGVVIGHNADIAWGLTDLSADVSDLYLERVRDDRYELDGAQLPLTTREETIEVAGGPPQRLTVRSTRHGPLISGVLGSVDEVTEHVEDGQRIEIALRWTALEPGRTMDAMLGLNSATDWGSFRAALADLTSPTQSVVYADREGHIGYQTPGLIPRRGKSDGRAPAAGWTSANDWAGFVPFDELPSVYDPPKGYVVTANNAVSADTEDPVSRDWGAGYRSDRIAELIERGADLDVEDVSRMQLDSHNANAAQLTPHLLRASPEPSAEAARNLLRDWDFTQGTDSAAAAYFNAVWRHLLALTFTDDLSRTPAQAVPDGGGRWFQVVGDLLSRPTDPLWRNEEDPRDLRDRDDVLAAALTDAAAELTEVLGEDPADWRWGDLHAVELRNQTLGAGGPAPIEWLLNRGPYELGGGTDSVNATAWAPESGYEVIWAPSMRMVVDLDDLGQSRWINQTGQSGHAYHDSYVDQADLWAMGETTAWLAEEADVRAAAENTLRLVPAGREP
ncbi:penicillin acylase family protein [Actinophytocola sediminis]